MKKLLLIMMLMTSMSYAEVTFAPEIEGTKWEYTIDKNNKVIVEIESPYFIFKEYKNSKLSDTGSKKIIVYEVHAGLHFFFEEDDLESPFILRINNDISSYLIRTSYTNILTLELSKLQ